MSDPLFKATADVLAALERWSEARASGEASRNMQATIELCVTWARYKRIRSSPAPAFTDEEGPTRPKGG